MLATLVIALREGLEAVLIVSIIATFLRKNHQSLTPMWWGVSAAVFLSCLVGAGLSLTEHALPQAQQEAMEAIIGVIAVLFVSSMIIWMQQHAPQLRHQLENEASLALSHSSRWALPAMAFLAVLKEGFETSVFMLATFSAASSMQGAAIGAVLGLLLALLIGYGIYRGGVRLNIGRFFKVTGLFLILVAAGLVVSALRSAHEAGWLLIGQQSVLDLRHLLPLGTLRSALVSGVLGIPADPRLAEVIGWLGYLIIFGLLLAWPQRYTPSPRLMRRLYLVTSLVTLFAAAACAQLLPLPTFSLTQSLPLISQHAEGRLDRTADGLEITLAGQSTRFIPYLPNTLSAATTVQTVTVPNHWQQAPTTLTLDQVISLYHHRVPPGLHPQQHPGPYQSQWQLSCELTITHYQGEIIAVQAQPRSLVTLTGSSLPSPRLLSVELPKAATDCGWQTSPAWQQQVTQAMTSYQDRLNLYDFFAHKLPPVLVVISLGAMILSARRKKPLTNFPKP